MPIIMGLVSTSDELGAGVLDPGVICADVLLDCPTPALGTELWAFTSIEGLEEGTPNNACE